MLLEKLTAQSRGFAGQAATDVGTGSGAVRLNRIQPPGKKMMNAADWGRGLSAGANDDEVVFS